MSTTENQNGTAAGAQSNGIKTLSSSSSTSSTASSTTSSGVSPSSGGRVSLSNNSNSSFLYSSSTMLSREKTRQVPPPTLPKYTSSFNAGSNGGGGGTAERLTRDREAGGSYRLASLDRLALRQRILDGEKANGEPISVSETTRDDRCDTDSTRQCYFRGAINFQLVDLCYLFTKLFFCSFFASQWIAYTRISWRWANIVLRNNITFNAVSNFILDT